MARLDDGLGADSRDLVGAARLPAGDNPALRAALDDGEAVLPLFVLDPALLSARWTAYVAIG